MTHNLLPEEAQAILRHAALSDRVNRADRGLNASYEAKHTDKAIARVKRLWPEYFRADA